MATTPIVIIPAQYVPATQTSMYVSTGIRTSIDTISLLNTSGTPVTVTIHLLPVGGTPTADNIVLSKTLLDGQSYSCPEIRGQNLSIGGSISVIGDTASSVTIMASGRAITV